MVTCERPVNTYRKSIVHCDWSELSNLPLIDCRINLVINWLKILRMKFQSSTLFSWLGRNKGFACYLFVRIKGQFLNLFVKYLIHAKRRLYEYVIGDYTYHVAVVIRVWFLKKEILFNLDFVTLYGHTGLLFGCHLLYTSATVPYYETSVVRLPLIRPAFSDWFGVKR